MLYPLKFHPVYKNYIWGGRQLESLLKNLPEGIIAEVWQVSSHPDGESIVANGNFSGEKLSDLVDKLGKKLLGSEISKEYENKIPILVKFIDASHKLSVQVHPNNETLKQNEKGKHEIWYVISAQPGSKIVYGIIPHITKGNFIQAIQDNNIECCLNYLEVFPGDIINIPAGVVHSLGEGIVVLEIQQNSNITYRLFDYNRVDFQGNKRPLHIEKALEVINFENCSICSKKTGLQIIVNENCSKIILIANKYFSIEEYCINGYVEENADGKKFFIYTCLYGEGRIHYANGIVNISQGESILIPAYLGIFKVYGNLKLLKCYVPNIQNDIINILINAGYTKDEIEMKVLS